MKKITAGIVILTVAMLLFTVNISLAAAVQELPVEIDNGTIIETETKILLKDNQIFMPTALIKEEIYHNIAIDSDNRQMILKFALPRVKTAERTVDKLLFSRMELALPYQLIAGKAYVDAQQAAKLLGFDISIAADKAIIKPNQFSSFAPRVLAKNNDAPKLPEKIQLAWQPTFEANSNLAVLPKHEGLNVVSPSWFAIINDTGLIQNKADAAYVKQAHERNYQVWALITNSFDPNLTHAVLADEKARQNIIKQLVVLVRAYELDGINLDFENIYDEDKAALTNFVKEISQALKSIGSVVSIDVTVPSNVAQWSSCYERDKLGKIVDYVMVMAYDEHWRTSKVSGSVASFSWVEQGIVNTIKDVPADKVVLGVPFYMREWQENLTGDKQVKARTMSMAQAEAVIKSRNLQPIWLEKAGQYYFEYQNEGKLYRVWQEDKRSLQLKTSLVEKYNLAGVAAWRKGFEQPEVWPMLSDTQPNKAINKAESKHKHSR